MTNLLPIVDWSDIAFSNKSSYKKLNSIFIASPRELSSERFKKLVKEYLPNSNLIIGIAKEDYISGFENQPQFRTLQISKIQSIINKVNKSKTPHKIYVIKLFQRDLINVIPKIKPKKVLLINGSWHSSFHLTPIFYELVKNNIPYVHISPFTDEAEAKNYEARLTKKLQSIHKSITQQKSLSIKEAIDASKLAATASFEHTFQVGAIIAKKSTNGRYSPIISTHNKVVPYETHAMHHGSLREKNFSPPKDQNFYDTVHAEMYALITATKKGIKLKNTALFINLMPCPTCARNLALSEISEIFYNTDYSDGYSAQILEASGKKVERVV
jgi:deoxycytidylate deaminase